MPRVIELGALGLLAALVALVCGCGPGRSATREVATPSEAPAAAPAPKPAPAPTLTAPPRLPGPCVPPPSRARSFEVRAFGVDQSGRSFRSEREEILATETIEDLDGDGVADLAVPHPTGGPCPWDVEVDIYVMRGACGHRVGTVIGTITRVEPRGALARHGVIETRATANDLSGAPIRIHRRTRVYAFDGAALELAADHDDVSRCFHCAATACDPR